MTCCSRATSTIGPSLDSKMGAVATRSERMLTRFVEENLPPIDSLAYIEVRFPWNRMFESDIIHTADEPVDISYFPKK